MKVKIKNKVKFLDYFIGGKFSIILITLLFALIFVYAYYIGDYFYELVSIPNFIDGIVFFFQDPIIIISTILLPMLIMSLNVMYRNESLGSNLIRYSTKKEYLYNIINYCFKLNTILFFIIVFIIMIAAFCMISSRISIAYIYEYKTINLLYLIFYLFKLYFIGQWLSISSVLILKSESKVFCVIINLLVYLPAFFTTIDESKNISSILNMPLLISDYFKMLNYNSFVLEIICFTIFLILLIYFGRIIYKMCCKRIRKIGEI